MSPLTCFLIDLITGKLPRRTAAQHARAYGINPDHCAGYIRMIGQRL